jgi:hypothetical protein
LFSDSILSQKNKLGQSTSKKQVKSLKFKEKIPAFSARLSPLIIFFQVFEGTYFFYLSEIKLSRKNIQKNKLGQSTSKKQLKIFQFKEKIPAFSARLLALISFFQVFESNFFFSCETAY